MNCTGKGEFRYAKLTNAAKSLELWRVNQRPRQQVNRLVLIEYDKAVYRIPKSFPHRIIPAQHTI